MKALTYVFVNQKGGVGKTTSAINIGAYLAEAGKKVLLVDFDSQGNLTSGVGGDKTKPGVYELISGSVSLDTALQETSVQNLYLVGANINLSGAAIELVEQKDRDYYLKRALEPARSRFDYILVDCPPSLGVLTLNGLIAADAVLIPLQCEYYALEGLSLLTQTVQRIQKNLNQELRIGGIFFTMYDQRTKLAQDVVRQVSAYFKDKVFKTIIPRNIRLSEAPSHGVPISQFDALCVGARSYKCLADEVMQNGR
jgi:chromosome partitioning protein